MLMSMSFSPASCQSNVGALLGSLTLISLKPALTRRSFADWTAWKGVGEASTKEMKSLAAASIPDVAMVECGLLCACAKAKRESMCSR